jgi:hypothetical protein
MKLLIMQFSPAFCHFIPLWSKCSQTPSVCVPPLMLETKFHTHTEPQAKLYSNILSFLWSGCMDPRILDLNTSWRSVVSFTSRPLYPRYPLDEREKIPFVPPPPQKISRLGDTWCCIRTDRLQNDGKPKKFRETPAVVLLRHGGSKPRLRREKQSRNLLSYSSARSLCLHRKMTPVEVAVPRSACLH